MGRGAVGTRLQGCVECGVVRDRRHRPRPGEYACSKACQEFRRYRRQAGGEVTPAAQPSAGEPFRWRVQTGDGPLRKLWPVTEVSPLPTAPAAPITERIDLPAEATDDAESEKPPDC